MAISRVQGQTTKAKITDIDIRSALAGAKTSQQAIRNLYDLWKRTHPRFSLTILCKRANISSKGYLSDVMSGKRTLNMKYRNSITEAFQLERENAHYLKTMIALDAAKTPAKKAQLTRKLSIAKKTINVQFLSMSHQYAGIFQALEVFCAFGLFQGKPTKAELKRFLSDFSATQLNESLALLMSMKLIEPGSKDDFKSLTEHFLLGEAAADFSHAEFIRLALAHAADNVAVWFPQKNRSYFVSSIVSVQMAHFEQVLEGLKSKMLLVQAELESSDADSLVRFNVQIYPTRSPD